MKPFGQEGVVVVPTKKNMQYTFIQGKARVRASGSNLAGAEVRNT